MLAVRRKIVGRHAADWRDVPFRISLEQFPPAPDLGAVFWYIERHIANDGDPAPGGVFFQFVPLFEPALLDSVLLYIYGVYNNKTTTKLAKVFGYKGKGKTDLAITNLTKLDIANKYGENKLSRIIFVAPMISYANRIISIATLEDEMIISCRTMDANDEVTEYQFFQKAIQIIRDKI